MPSVDYFDLAQKATREQFVERCPFPFLVGADVLRRPHGPTPTMVFEGRGGALTAVNGESGEERPAILRPLVLAVRKVQAMFPSRISIGRTSNNDVVIADVQVSKVHAFIKVADDQYELSDAGSRNGTFLGDERLIDKGKGHLLAFGDRLRFGTLEFVFAEASVCWQRARNWKK